MNLALFTRNGTVQTIAQTPEPRANASRSLGLNALFQALDQDRKYSILDLGPAIGASIEFLSRYASRIRVEDLYKTLAEARFFERNEEPVDQTVLSGILSIPAFERFDIVLSWDLVNYFKQEEFRALVGYLDAFCAAGTFFFAISSTLKEMPSVPISYRILDAETLLYCVDSPATSPCPRYAPRDVSLLMSSYRIHSSYQLRNGMQEYVFVRK